MKKAAGIAFTDGTHILIVKNQEDIWSIPGGKGLEGESYSEIANREVREEIGNVPEYKKLGEIDNFGGKERSFRTFVGLVSQKPSCKLSKEHKAHQWVKLSMLSEIEGLHPQFRKILPKLVNMIMNKTENSFKNWIKASDALFIDVGLNPPMSEINLFKTRAEIERLYGKPGEKAASNVAMASNQQSQLPPNNVAMASNQQSLPQQQPVQQTQQQAQQQPMQSNHPVIQAMHGIDSKLLSNLNGTEIERLATDLAKNLKQQPPSRNELIAFMKSIGLIGVAP